MNPVLYFDGKVSDPHPALLELGQRLAVLRSPDGEVLREFHYGDIAHLDKAGEKYQLELKPFISGEAAELLQFEDLDLYKRLEYHWGLHTSSIKKSIRFFDKQGLAGKIGITLLIGGVFLYLIFLMFNNIHRVMPVKYDLYLGEKIEKQLLSKLELCQADSLNDFVKKAEKALSRPEDKFPLRIHLVNHPLINAVAFPGGKIFLFRGLVESSGSPEEVLGVLAHEIEHGERRHGVKQMFRSIGAGFMASMIIGMAVEGVEVFEGAELISEMASTLLYLKYSRNFEKEADMLAVERLQQKKISVKPMSDFFKRLDSLAEKEDKKKDKKEKTDKTREKNAEMAGRDKEGSPAKNEDSFSTWFQTHPKSSRRYDYISEAARKENFPPNPMIEAERRNWDEIKLSCPDPKTPVKLWKLLF